MPKTVEVPIPIRIDKLTEILRIRGVLYPIFGITKFETSWSRFDHCVIAWGGVIAQSVVALPIVGWVILFGYTRFEPINAVLAILGFFRTSPVGSLVILLG